MCDRLVARMGETWELYVYSDVEMQLACHLAILNLRSENEKQAVMMMEKLYSLMKTKVYCENSMHRFSQIIYELAKYKNKTGDYEGAVSLCRSAIEMMPKENRFRFLPQIFREKAKAEVSLILCHEIDNDNDRGIYENSLDYRYYKMLNSIYEMFDYEFDADEYYFLVREYNAAFIGKIIKQRRELMNMTQEEIIVADEDTGNEDGMICSLDTISRIENGKVSTSWKVTRQLLKKINLPPARFFDFYISSDINSEKEIMEIEQKLVQEKYSEAQEMLNTLEEKNKYRNLPYNKLYVSGTEAEIESGLTGIDDEEEILKRLEESFDRCLPNYMESNGNIFLLIMEQTILRMIMGKKTKNGSISNSEKTKAYKKIIEGYKYLNDNYELYIRHVLKILRAYESNIANAGNFK